MTPFEQWFEGADPDVLEEDRFAAMRARGQLRGALLVARDVLGENASESAALAVFEAIQREAATMRGELPACEAATVH